MHGLGASIPLHQGAMPPPKVLCSPEASAPVFALSHGSFFHEVCMSLSIASDGEAHGEVHCWVIRCGVNIPGHAYTTWMVYPITHLEYIGGDGVAHCIEATHLESRLPEEIL